MSFCQIQDEGFFTNGIEGFGKAGNILSIIFLYCTKGCEKFYMDSALEEKK